MSNRDWRQAGATPVESNPANDSLAASAARAEPRHHCIISGTGRSGTSFLMQLLTKLRLDTGYTFSEAALENQAHAGLERARFFESSPYIMKSPYFCDTLRDELASKNIVIDMALIPVRNLSAAAASRVRIHEAAAARGGRAARGGLWGTAMPAEQETVLARKLTKLIEVLAQHDVPTTFLWFPRLTQDPDYLYAKLRFLLRAMSREDFDDAFRSVVRPDWVHGFSENDR